MRNRIIKFRGLIKTTGKFFYGSLIQNNGKPYLVNNVIESNEEYIALENWCPVIPETVGEYTGLKDKNGKEIYEGDIVKHGESIRIVEYRWSNFSLILPDKSSTILLSFSKYPKVIGNIHENPELL